MNGIKGKLEEFKERGVELKKEIRERTIGYILAAFGFVAGLAWNEAIKALIEYFFPLSKNTIWAKLIYAFVATLVVVMVSIYLIRFINKEKK